MYVAGVEIDHSKSVSSLVILWTSGVPTYLTAETVGSHAEKVFAIGRNIYLAGTIAPTEGTIATL